MKAIILVVLSVLTSGHALACAFAGYETLQGQIADDINRVYDGQIDTTCSVARSNENRFRCSIACIDFKANFSTKDDRQKYIAVVTAATQKSLGEVVPGDFVQLSVMDGYMASKNTTATLDIQKARRIWNQVGKGKNALDRLTKKLAPIIRYEPLMTNKPMLPMD